MRFNKEKKTRKLFLIDFEEVSEETFYSELEEAITNEYDEATYNYYLRDNYCDIEIEDHYYEPSDVLVNMGDYDSAYEEWLENKTQFIMEDFDNGVCSSMHIYMSDFEIEKIEEDFINIELTNEEANMLFIVLDSNKSVAEYSQMGKTAEKFLQMLCDFSKIER